MQSSPCGMETTAKTGMSRNCFFGKRAPNITRKGPYIVTGTPCIRVRPSPPTAARARCPKLCSASLRARSGSPCCCCTNSRSIASLHAMKICLKNFRHKKFPIENPFSHFGFSPLWLFAITGANNHEKILKESSK